MPKDEVVTILNLKSCSRLFLHLNDTLLHWPARTELNGSGDAAENYKVIQVVPLFILLSISGFQIDSYAADTATVLDAAEAGSADALNQAFELHTKVDGGDAEDIDCAIGKSIRRNPKIFLTALKKNRSKVPRLDSVLGNLGPEYIDDLKKQTTELKRRLIAIQSVQDKSLKSVRIECEVELRQQLIKYSKD